MDVKEGESPSDLFHDERMIVTQQVTCKGGKELLRSLLQEMSSV